MDTSGAGVTYEVQNEIAQRREMLKVLPRDLQDDRERVERFLREAKILGRVDEGHAGLQGSMNCRDGRLDAYGIRQDDSYVNGPIHI